jgi:hypothetical protein
MDRGNKPKKEIRNTSKTKEVDRKRSFLEIFIADKRKIPKSTIEEAAKLASQEESSSRDYNTLVDKIKSVKKWVRNNQEHLEKIGSSLDEFNELAKKAKEHKSNMIGLTGMGMFSMPQVQREMPLYKATVKEEIKIAFKLYDYLHNSSAVNNEENPFDDANEITENNPFDDTNKV